MCYLEKCLLNSLLSIFSRGDKIRLATPLNRAKPNSFYEKELNYLFEKGYKVSSDGQWLIK